MPWPARVFQSTGLTPAAWTRTSTSVGRGSGRATSSGVRTSGPPNSLIVTARMVWPLIVRCSCSSGVVRRGVPGAIHPAARVRARVSGLRDTCRTIPAMTHRVAVLALDGVLPLDLGIPARVFNEARAADGSRLYSVGTCSIGGRPVRTHEDFRIVVETTSRCWRRRTRW